MQPLARRLATAPALPRPDEPVPIALVITELDVGGAEKALVSLATGLDRARWAPEVIALGPEGPLADPLRAADIPMTCLGARREHPLRALRALASTLRRRPPRLIQSFLFHANIAARLAAPRAGRPWVLGGLRVAEREKGWHLRLDSLTQRLALGSVCVSRGVERFTRTEGGIEPGRLAVIPNGIDPAPFDQAQPLDRQTLGVPAGVPLALFIGRLDRQKGLDILLESAAAAGLAPVHLAAAGDGPEGPALRERAASRDSLRGRVHWLGRRDDVPDLLATADLLILPSRWEGMPNVVLEAMAARRPVIATAVEGSEDLVVPGETGWLVPPDDAPALAGALIEAIADPARLRTFGAAGRLRVERRFSIASTVRAYDRLWSRILGFEDDIPKTPPPADR